MNKRTEIFSGSALGLLTGLIIGLSISQVVGIVLGALTSLLTLFFGLKPDTPNSADNKLNYSLIGIFSFSCFISIILGIYIRTHNLLSPTLKEKVNQWHQAGYSKTQALNIAAFQEAGIVIGNDKITVMPEAKLQNERVATMSILMSQKIANPLICNDYKTLTELKSLFTITDTTLKPVLQKIEKASKDTVEEKLKIQEFQKLYCEYFSN
ncbi:hypothetical protein [Mucilaginibacter jinjuensis]|uniref:Uncharacterized protein n=1 Tax=Mucilaginibacter jinjuensis TaxID=1176721 RepID=A0ABY7TGK7_9SPHI|nr:hypothetical protein [Mucilaginibacter jinjuensis]WCT14712.1 hypothetical protein PQO05_12275 [Mucilaginibacter jinjuensis]